MAAVVDVVVVVAAVVLFAFDPLPKINEVALSALALPTIPIMAETDKIKTISIRNFILYHGKIEISKSKIHTKHIH